VYLSTQFLQIGAAFNAVRECNPDVVKLVNPPKERPHYGATSYVGRLEQEDGCPVSEGELVDKGAEGALIWWSHYGNWVDARPYLAGIECLNEPEIDGDDRPKRFASYAMEWLYIMDHRYGGERVGIVGTSARATASQRVSNTSSH